MISPWTNQKVSRRWGWKFGSEKGKARTAAPGLPDCLCVITGGGRAGQPVWEDVLPAAHCQPLLDLLLFFLTLGRVPSPDTGSNDLRGG